METRFIGVQVLFIAAPALTATGLNIPEQFLLQVPDTAIPMAGDVLVLPDYSYADGSALTVKVAFRAFSMSGKARKYMPYLYVDLVPTLLPAPG